MPPYGVPALRRLLRRHASEASPATSFVGSVHAFVAPPRRYSLGRTLASLLVLTSIGWATRWPFRHNPGHTSDLNQFRTWADDAAVRGFVHLMQRADYDYTPIYGYVLVILAYIRTVLLGQPFRVDDPSVLTLLKLPAIASDLALAGVLFIFLLRAAGARWAWIGALAYALSPVAIYDSAVWGQTDAVVALPMVLAVICLIRRRPNLASALLTIAILTKFQAVVLVPVLLVVVLRLGGQRGLLRAGLTAAGSVLVALLPVIVNGLLGHVVELYLSLTRQSPVVSFNAFSFWWIVNWLVTGHPNVTVLDTDSLLGPLTYKMAGLSLFAVCLAVIAYALYRAPLSLRSITLASAGSVLAFYLLATEMHERYFFPALPLLLLSVSDRRLRAQYIALNLTGFLNLHWVLVANNGGHWSVARLASTALLAVVNCGVLLWIGGLLWPLENIHGRRSRGLWAFQAAVLGMLVVMATWSVARWYLTRL